jgi:TrmH family RNA methyltransferase
LFVADGTKLLAEAVRWWPGLETVILSDGVEADVPDHVRIVRVPGDVMESISPMKSPQGALFLCRLPEKKELTVTPGMLLLDGIQDPGNVGTILRTADALEIPVVLLEGCADPYSHKVVRSSMGAVFRTGVVEASWEQVAAACKKAGIPVAVTALSDRAEDIRKAELNRCAVVIGSEGQGVRKEILSSADMELIIPMNERCESLNAAIAAAIVMWQMKQ